MNEPAIRRAILIQVFVFLVFHLLLYLESTELTNALYLGHVSQYLEELFPAMLWNVAFGEMFPGQFWLFLSLPVLGLIFLIRARDRTRRKFSLVVFHIAFATWTVFPLLAAKLGGLSGSVTPGKTTGGDGKADPVGRRLTSVVRFRTLQTRSRTRW